MSALCSHFTSECDDGCSGMARPVVAGILGIPINAQCPVHAYQNAEPGLGQNSVRVFANAVRCSERSGVRVSKRSGRVFGFVFCSALFLNCSVFCFVRPFRGCVLFGCFVRVFPPIVSLFGCFDWRDDDDLIRCFVRLLVITQCFVQCPVHAYQNAEALHHMLCSEHEN